MLSFKFFLLNEEQAYLSHRIGDVLTAVHSLEEDLPGMGSRQVSKIAEEIVNQIRKILHGQWAPRYTSDLKELQKLGVALMKAIDEKGDLNSLVPSIAHKLEDISSKLGVRTNSIQAPPEDNEQDGVNGQDMNMQLTGMGPSQQPQQTPQTPGGGMMPQNPPAMPQTPQTPL